MNISIKMLCGQEQLYLEATLEEEAILLEQFGNVGEDLVAIIHKDRDYEFPLIVIGKKR